MNFKKLIRRGVVDFIKRKTLLRKKNCRYDNQTRKKIVLLFERPLRMNEYTSTQSTEGTKQFC